MKARCTWLCAAIVFSIAACGEGNNSKAEAGTTPAPDSSITSYSTNFNFTENPLDEGGKWINGKAIGLDWNNVQSVFGRAYASVVSGVPNRYNDSIAHLNTTFTANHYAQGTVYRAAGYNPLPSQHEVELLLRFEITPNSARGYEILWGVGGNLAIVRWNGPLASYTGLYNSGLPGIGAAVDGDILRAEIRDNIITVYKNGVLVATFDITSKGGAVWTTGQPGIGFWPVESASLEKYGWKNYQAGNL